MSKKPPLSGIDALGEAIARARIPEAIGGVAERARRVLLAYVDASAGQGRTAREIARELASGGAAVTAARVSLDQMPSDPARACQNGCAFCCILAGDEGALISAVEARALHKTLAPFAGQRDGRSWTKRACPALDPDTRTCRAYAARPVICRSYVSTDATACEAATQGQDVPGPGVLGPHIDYLFVLSLARAALKGHAKVSTFSLARVAQAAVEGEDIETALAAARHRPKTLDDERKRIAGAR